MLKLDRSPTLADRILTFMGAYDRLSREIKRDGWPRADPGRQHPGVAPRTAPIPYVSPEG